MGLALNFKGRYAHIVTLANLVAWAFVIVTAAVVFRDLPSGDEWLRAVSFETLSALVSLAGLLLLTMLLRGIRWARLVNPHFHMPWRQAIPLYGWGFLLMTFSPFRMGDLARAWWIKRDGGSGFAAVGSIIAERVTDVAVVLLFLGLSVWVLQPSDPVWRLVSQVLTLLTVTGYAALAYGSRPVSRWLRDRLAVLPGEDSRRGRMYPALLRLTRILEGLACIQFTAATLWIVLLTLFIWLGIISGCHLYLLTFFPDLHWSTTMAVLAVVNFSSLFWAIPGNLGMYEMGAVATLAAFGIDKAEALVAITGMHAVVLLSVLLYGGICKVLLKNHKLKFWQIL